MFSISSTMFLVQQSFIYNWLVYYWIILCQGVLVFQPGQELQDYVIYSQTPRSKLPTSFDRYIVIFVGVICTIHNV